MSRSRRRILVEVPAPLTPGEGLGRRDAVKDLHDATLVHAVLGPRPGEVLHAGHLDEGHDAGAIEAADPVAVGVASRVRDDARLPGHDVHQGVRIVGVDPEVVRRPRPRGALDPVLVVSHDDDGSVRFAGHGVEPGQLFRTDPAGRRRRDHRVQQGQPDPGQVDHLVAGVRVLPAVGVVVAPHDVEPVPEGAAVAGLERGELLVHAVHGQVALGDEAAGSSAAISSTAPWFMVSGYAALPARRAGQVRAGCRRSARFDLTEVHVVHRGEDESSSPPGRGSVRTATPSSS